jgi:hypothetical protein
MAIGYPLSAVSRAMAIGYWLSAVSMTSGRQPAAGSRQRRAGISLLEVLFAMFVMTVGLLGLATLVPVGQFQVTQATHIDAAAVISRSALREFKVRDLMDEECWVDSAGTYTTTPPNPFMIDGIGFADGHTQFPYNALLGGVTNMDRITIKDIENNTTITTAQADRIFRLTDDKIFSLATDTTQRPELVNSTGTAQEQSRGEYSWMVMVSPLLYHKFNATTNMYDATYHTAVGRINIVAFHRRDVSDTGSPASERAVWGDVNASGQGTFDLTIYNDSALALADLGEAKKALKLLPGEWVMLSGGSTGQHGWYRVVAASEVELQSGSIYQADVTLAGPDISFTDVTAGGTPQVVVTICDGVIGVFEKTVQLDEPSLWSSH